MNTEKEEERVQIRERAKEVEWSHEAAAMVSDIVATKWIVSKATDN